MWFCVSLLRVAEKNGQRDEKSLWEERFMLIKSANEQDARSQIEETCSQNQAAYKNNKGELISWKFVTVERVYPIDQDNLTSGTEVFSRFLRSSEAQSLMTPFAEAEQ
jgi:hypothetical protein